MHRWLPMLLLCAALQASSFPQGVPLGATAAQAADADLAYVVSGVEVDVTAASAAAARDQAIAGAQQRAWQQLYQRLTGAADADRAPRLAEVDLARLVQGVEVEQERASAVRYLGVITVSFRAPAIRAFMRTANVRYTDGRSRAVLLLPVDASGAAPVLWDAANPWRAAWAAVRPIGLVPLELAAGEAADQADVTAQQAAAFDAEALARLARRYAVRQIAVAKLMADGSVQVAHAAPGAAAMFEAAAPARQPAQPGLPDLTLKRGINGVRMALDLDWARANLVDAGIENVTQVRVPLGSLATWVEVRRRLAEVPTVVQADVLALSRDQARLDLRHLGDAQRLRTALAQQKLMLGTSATPGVLELRLDDR